MAITDPNTIEIVDQSSLTENRFELKIDGCSHVLLKQDKKTRKIKYHVYFAGPFSHEEARTILEGMLELSFKADELNLGNQNVKKKNRGK